MSRITSEKFKDRPNNLYKKVLNKHVTSENIKQNIREVKFKVWNSGTTHQISLKTDPTTCTAEE